MGIASYKARLPPVFTTKNAVPMTHVSNETDPRRYSAPNEKVRDNKESNTEGGENMLEHLKPYVTWGGVLGLMAVLTFFLGY